MKHPYVISSDAANPYSPANHTGTVNRRVISRDTVGAKYVEVLIGTIEKSHGALRHLHPDLEQASYLLQGEGIGELNGLEKIAKPGYWMLSPEGAPHRFKVTSDAPVKVLVVYAPPYAENPHAAVNCEDHRPEGVPTAVDAGYGPVDATPFAPKLSIGLQYSYALDMPESAAKHMRIYDARFDPGAEQASHAKNGMEQVIFLREGSISGEINGHPFEAAEGDWVFIPDGAVHTYKAAPQSGAEAFVVHAFSPNQ